MEFWLSKETDRRKALLYILLFSNYSISLPRLVTLLRVDKKTVENDISFLNDYWSEILLISNNDNSITLQELPYSNIQDVFFDMVNESLYLNVLEAVILKKCSSIEALAENFYVSVSTIRRILKQINSNLSKKEITINMKNLELESSNKVALSMFCFYFFIEKIGFLNWPFDFIEQEPLLTIIENSCKQFDLEISRRFKFILSYFMAITIQADTLLISPKDRCFIKSVEREITSSILDVFGPSLSENLLNRLKDLLISILSKVHEFINSKYNRKIIHHFIDNLEMKLAIKLDEESFEKLMFVFSYIHFTNEVYPYDHFLVFDRDYFNGYSIKQYFPQFTTEVEEGLKYLEQVMDIPWFTRFKNILLHDVFIIWKNLPQQILASRNKVSISIITPLDIEYLNTIEYFVSESIEKNCITLLKKENFSTKDYEKFNDFLAESKLIISNKGLEKYKDKQFIVSDIPDKQQLKNLNQMIQKLWIGK